MEESDRTHQFDLRRTWSVVVDHAPSWTPPPIPTVVVVPHPDDEVLMFGGLILHQLALDVPVTVIAVTDGEAAYDSRGDPQLGAERAVEQRRALASLGVQKSVHRMQIPDGDVTANASELRRRISSFAEPDALIVAPWTSDVHPDHEACGVAALSAASRTGAQLYFGLFWTWHRRQPSDLKDRGLVGLPLDSVLVARRRAALAEHRSQFTVSDGEPVLDDRTCEPVDWSHEYYLPAGIR